MVALDVILLILSLVFAIVATIVGYSGSPAGPPTAGWARANYLALAFALLVAVVLLGVLFGGPVVLIK